MKVLNFNVKWSEEDGEYVGTCDQFPSLSWLAKSEDEALNGIEQLVHDVRCDLSSAWGIDL